MSKENTLQDLPPIVTVPELAPYLKVARSTVWRWIYSGRIPSIRIGRTRRIKREDVEQCLKSGDIQPESVTQKRNKILKDMRIFTGGHPLFKLMGIGDSGKGDISSDKYKYLAEAYRSKE